MRQPVANIPTRGRPVSSALKDAVHDMEPELRHLEGVVALLTILGEAQDLVEPAALSALAKSARQIFEALSVSWRTAFEGMRQT